MAIIQAADIDDLVIGTTRKLNKGTHIQFGQRLTRYEVTEKLFKKDKVVMSGGYEVQWDVMVDHSDSSAMVGLFNQDDTDVPAIMQQITVPFRHQQTYWTYDTREKSMNSGTEKIVDVVKMRHDGALIALAEKAEDQFFGEPASSTDVTSVFGLKYWVVANGTTGFTGGNNSNFSAGPGGLDSSNFTRWKNYAGLYTNVTRDDLVREIKTAFKKIDFQAPLGVTDFRSGRGQRYRIYLDETRHTLLEELAENQNDKLGSNLASMDGQTTIKGIALTYVPKLDGVTSPTAPVYMLDFNSFFPIVMKSNFMQQTGPVTKGGQHTVKEVFIDLSWNIACVYRRGQAVLATAV